MALGALDNVFKKLSVNGFIKLLLGISLIEIAIFSSCIKLESKVCDRSMNLLQCFVSFVIFFPTKARSSVVEHHLDMVGVGGSIPLVLPFNGSYREYRPYSNIS